LEASQCEVLEQIFSQLPEHRNNLSIRLSLRQIRPDPDHFLIGRVIRVDDLHLLLFTFRVKLVVNFSADIFSELEEVIEFDLERVI